jgi:hypothetical protein
VKGWKTIFQANGQNKKKTNKTKQNKTKQKQQAAVAILILNKIDFQTKLLKKTRRGTSYHQR